LDQPDLLHAVSDIFQLRPDAQQRHRAGRRLGLLSNTYNPHWRQLHEHVFGPLADLFPVKVLDSQTSLRLDGVTGCLPTRLHLFRQSLDDGFVRR